MKGNWKSYVPWILLSEAFGALSGWMTGDAMAIYGETIVKPPLSPPAWLFPIVWAILYALMGIGATKIYQSPPSKVRSLGLNLFVIQLVVNFFWSPIFFNLRIFGFAFYWLLLLWALVLRMVFVFGKIDPWAAKLQIPYLIWLTFAAYLNLGVWYLNA